MGHTQTYGKRQLQLQLQLLGYRRDKLTKEIVIIPEEAEAVRKIYSLYIQGNTLEQIKEYLESRQIKTSRGKYEWSKAGIKAILTNEKYVGDILYQKSFHPNLISKKVIRNCGEMDRYMVSNNHPAIIDRNCLACQKGNVQKKLKETFFRKLYNRAWKIQRQIRIKRAVILRSMRQPDQTENMDKKRR